MSIIIIILVVEVQHKHVGSIKMLVLATVK